MTIAIDRKNYINYGIVIFIILISIYSNFIGYIYIGEIIGLFYVLLKWPKLPRSLKKCIFFGFLWAFVQLLSDILNHIPIFISLKGIFAPIILLSTIIYFYVGFLKNPRLIHSFLIGFILGICIITSIFQFPLVYENPWKWVIGSLINSLFAIWFSFYSQKKNIYLYLFIILFFLISNIFSSRSISLCAIISTLLYFIFKNNNVSNYFSKNFAKVSFKLQILFFCIVILFFFNLIGSIFYSSEFYTRNASDGDKTKSINQANSSYGILLGGRSEVLISFKAFLDKPLLGHGSWARDDGNYINDYLKVIEKSGIDMGDDGAIFDWGYIPVHSYIFGTLVWAGIFASFFWFFVLFKMFNLIFLYGNQLSYFTFLIIITLIWNIFFSPFGYNHRWESAFRIAYILYVENLIEVKSNKKMLFLY